MAFGKPCVVQGEKGFFRILDGCSAREFRWHGFYGIGDGGTGEDTLVAQLGRLLDDPGLRAANGAFAREMVTRHYSLEHALDLQLAWYHRALAESVRPRKRDMARTVAATSAWMAQRALQRGRDGEDYFNSAARIAEGIVAPIPDWFEPATTTTKDDGAPTITLPEQTGGFGVVRTS